MCTAGGEKRLYVICTVEAMCIVGVMCTAGGDRAEGVKSLQFQNKCFTEMRIGSEEDSYVRLIDGCITQL